MDTRELSLRLMRPAEYERFVARLRADFARNASFAVQAPRQVGEALAERMLSVELPEGLSTKNNFLYCLQLSDEPEAVGAMWYQMLDHGGELHAFLIDLHLDEPYRGDGRPEQALSLFEQRVMKTGVQAIHVRLFAHNGRLRTLLQKAGYLPSELKMSRRL